jgi:TolB-like protein
MADIFLSYSRQDQATARRFAEGLEREGFTVWWDQALSAGEAFDRVTEKALDEAKAVVVLWSKKSVESRWVRAEATLAHTNNRLVPAMIEACRRPMLFELTHTPDLSGWNGEVDDARWRSFIGDLRKFVVKSGPPSTTDSRIDVEPGAPPAGVSKGGLNALRFKRKPLVMGALASLLLVAAVLALLATRASHRAPTVAATGGAAKVSATVPPRLVAVLAFEDLSSDGKLQQFSRSLIAEIIGQLNRNHVPVASGAGTSASGSAELAPPTQRLNVAYAFGGTVERSGTDILARVRLDDVRQNTAAWSSEYRAADGEAKSLQEQIAMEAAIVANTALEADRRVGRDLEAVNLLIQATLYAMRNRPDELDANWQNAKRLVEKFPDIPHMHAQLATISAFLVPRSPPERAAMLRSLAMKEAELALKLNPKMDVAGVRVLLVPAIGHWGERESLLGGDGNNWKCNLLREVGRFNDALDCGRQAQAPTPASPNRNATLLLALASKGRMNEAMPLAEQSWRAWPTHSAVWNARLHTLLFAKRWDAALGLFTEGAFRPIEVDDSTFRTWRSALEAMKAGSATARHNAAKAMLGIIGPGQDLVSMLPHEVYDQGNAIAMLAMLGDVDAAFEQARKYLVRDSFANSSFLFWPNLGAFRADPRFMKLAADIGLVDYWRSAGKWPDFCDEPGRPYDCKAVAATANEH